MLRATLATVALTLCLSPSAAPAGFIVSIEQVGGNVVATGAGSINTAGLGGPLLEVSASPRIDANNATIVIGQSSINQLWTGPINGPQVLGSGIVRNASSSSGHFVGIMGLLDRIYLPQTYVSGAPLLGSATFNNTTLAALGLTNGTYNYTLPSADTFTVQVGPAAVPEPSSLALLSLCGAVGGVAAWRKRRGFARAV